MSALTQLRELAPLPAAGGGGVRPDWQQVATRWGFTPPQDYQQIIETYGPGLFVDEVNVWTPDTATTDGGVLAMDELGESRDWINDNHLSWTYPGGDTSPIELGEEPLAFAVWGSGSSGSYGYWHKIGDDPNSWPVLYTDLSSLWLYHDGGIAAFLVDLLHGNYPTELIDGVPTDTPDAAPYFQPNHSPPHQ